MFRLILPLSARKLLVSTIAAILTCNVGAIAQGSPARKIQARNSKKSIEQTLKMKFSIIPELSGLAVLPFVVKKSIRLVNFNNQRSLVIPVVLRYEGFSGGQCRLATMSEDFSHSELINVPLSAGVDECKNITSVYYLDINHGGASDVVQIISVKSNRYDVYVAVAVVYLANSASPGGYCYSAQASDALNSSVLASKDIIEDKLEYVRRALKLSNYSCS